MVTDILDMLMPRRIPSESLVREWVAANGLGDGRASEPQGQRLLSNLELANEIEEQLNNFAPAADFAATAEGLREDLAHDAYFHIQRVEHDEAMVFVRMALCARLLFLQEVDEAPVTISQRVLDVIDTAFADLISCLGGGGVNEGRAVTHWQSRGVSRRAMPRWVRGHQVFAALTQGLIFSFQAMAHALRAGRKQEVQRWADLSISLLKGSGAAFEFTADFAVEDYADVVRPSMMPPVSDVCLSGLMSIDHRFLAQAMRDMRPTLKALCEHEQTRHDGISEALSGVYDSHIHVCERFVGAKPSILTEGRTVRSGPSLIEQFKTLRLKPFEQPVHVPQLMADARRAGSGCPFH